MFVLAIIEDKIKIAPEQFEIDPTIVFKEQIDIKFSNKILLEVGLCICFYDFIEVGDPYVYPAEGSCHQLVRFRMVVFRPFVGEIITGKILSTNPDGIRVTTRFFDDIFVPSHLLQVPSLFDEEKQVWIWKYDGDEGGTELLMEIGDEIRIRVRTINFTRLTTTAKGVEATTTSEFHVKQAAVPALHRNLSDTIDESASMIRRRSSSSLGLAEEELPAAMQVIGCANDDGLGLVAWWS